MSDVVLAEHQHELCEVTGNTPGLVFGTEDTGYVTLSRPLVVAGEVRSADRDRPQEDGRAWGRDFRGAKSYSFEIGVLTDTLSVGALDPHRTNLDYLSIIDAVWNDRKWRRTARSFAMLRTREAGQTVRCYGRPRRYEEAVGVLTARGYTPIMAIFDLVDGHWYDDVETVVDVDVSPSEGGLVAPLSAPFTTTTSGAVPESVTIGGRSPTWPVIEFHGPVVRPVFTLGGWTVGLDAVIADGQHVTFDPRPWERTVLRSDGVNMAGLLSARTTAMRDFAVDPGTYDALFEGLDVSETSWARLRYRNARPRP